MNTKTLFIFPHFIFTLFLIALLSGCSSYIPPGRRADLQQLAPSAPVAQTDSQTAPRTFTDANASAPASAEQLLAAQPANPFPTGIVMVRLQAPDYTNYYIDQNGGKFGEGRFCVVLTKELGENEQYERLSKLPKIADVIGLNRILLPQRFDSLEQIRAAAARLSAGMVLLYTVDTKYRDTNSSKTLTAISLGMSSTKKITVLTTVSALLMDTKTGYIYSAYETTEKEEISSSAWGTRENADKARQKTEARAFARLVDDFVESWPRLLKRYPAK